MYLIYLYELTFALFSWLYLADIVLALTVVNGVMWCRKRSLRTTTEADSADVALETDSL